MTRCGRVSIYIYVCSKKVRNCSKILQDILSALRTYAFTGRIGMSGKRGFCEVNAESGKKCSPKVTIHGRNAHELCIYDPIQ